jgi:adenylate kinase
VFLGYPGAGKGTQATIASKNLGIPIVATGAIFREAIANNTALGKEVSQFVNCGLLVPDKLTNAVIVERLKKEDCAKGFLLDGYPRSMGQAKALDAHLTKVKHPLEKVIYFEVDVTVVVNRIGQRRICSKCGAIFNLVSHPPKKADACDRCGGELIMRLDDKPDAIRRRLKTYTDNTQPLLDYYRQQGILNVLDASMDVNDASKAVAALAGATV